MIQATQPLEEKRGVPETYRGVAGQLDLAAAYRLMVRARVLEERLIKMAKSQDGQFWIGGPGEEAFNVPLGLLVKCGQGLDHDFLHLHYRSSAILLALGARMIDFIRQMASRASDPFSGGRNFVNHVAVREWNIVPTSSTIETQYSIAPGTALAQLRAGGDAITIVNGGDAGSAEADFATCLNWSSRPDRELPILIVVANNRFGISTPCEEVHGDAIIARRAAAFGIRWDTVDGNDPEASWRMLSEAIAYVRAERKPFCLEAAVGRLHGHSSSSGAAREDGFDCVGAFAEKLVERGVLSPEQVAALHEESRQEALDALHQVRREPAPAADSIHDHTFA